MKLIRFNFETVSAVTLPSKVLDRTAAISPDTDVFVDELGKLVTAVHVDTDQANPSTGQSARIIPEALKADFLVELNRLASLGAIQRISEPTE